MCAVKSFFFFFLHQPLLHAHVEHCLVRVPKHVFDAGNRTDDQISTSRQRLQAEDIPQIYLRQEQKKKRKELNYFVIQAKLKMNMHFMFSAV